MSLVTVLYQDPKNSAQAEFLVSKSPELFACGQVLHHPCLPAGRPNPSHYFRQMLICLWHEAERGGSRGTRNMDSENIVLYIFYNLK